jgi:hypothetical protein
MKGYRWIASLFWIASAYDGILGAVFLVAPLATFDWFRVTHPNHVGYVQFPAALLIVFAAMFAAVALDPFKRRTLILYGMGLKASYCLVAGGHWLIAGIPSMWKPFVLVDLAMLVLFLAAYIALGDTAVEARPATVK